MVTIRGAVEAQGIYRRGGGEVIMGSGFEWRE